MDLHCDLGDRVIVVTGGSRGIGFVLARAFADSGAVIIIVNRHSPEGEEAAYRIRDRGGNAVSIPADVSDPQQVDSAFREALDRFGRIDVVVNAAGTNIRTPAADLTEDQWDEVAAVNLKGLFFCCQAAARHMSAQGGGKIINISSLAGTHGFRDRSVYSATKAGVTQLSKALALEWADRGLTVNAIAPGLLRTPLTEGYIEAKPERAARVLAKMPLGRFGSPEDLIGVALLLASDASGYITGQTIVVDGGYSLGDMDW